MAENEGLDLKGKLGPLPVWVWGLGLGAIVVVFVWAQNRGTSGATEAPEETYTDPYDDYDSVLNQMSNTSGGSSSTSGSTGDLQLDTNQAWSIRAVAYLVTKGQSPLTAQGAIGAYLSEKSLTDAQKKLVNDAIVGIGQPPDPVTLGSGVGTPTGTTTVAIRHWRRDNAGNITKMMTDGNIVKSSLSEYINAGMPKFYTNAYEYQTYRAKSNATTVAMIAKLFDTSVANLQVLNGWKSIPNLKKNQSVKVPARKGTGKV